MKTVLQQHHFKVLRTAMSTLQDFLDNKPFQSTVYGQKTVVRDGQKRAVHYLEVQDGSGPTLCIEVYTK